MKSDEDLRRIHHARLVVQQTDELLGLIKGALLDGSLNELEAAGIYRWLDWNRLCRDEWPANILHRRLREALADGKLDREELDDLYGLMMQITAPASTPGNTPAQTPTTLPLSAPPFDILYPDRSFCFTGVFDYGTRQDCHDAVSARGGIPAKSITKNLHYLVIGNIGSDVWLHSSFGTKIKKAVEYRDSGRPLTIISEATWSNSLA